MSRESIFVEVAAERARQDALFGGAEHDDQHSVTHWIAILCRHVGLATDDGSPDNVCLLDHQLAGHDPARYRRQLVRVAAVAIAALESYERKLEQIATPPDPLLVLAQRLASEHGEDVLIVRNPPRLSYQECNPSPYVVLASVASAEEERVGTRVKP